MYGSAPPPSTSSTNGSSASSAAPPSRFRAAIQQHSASGGVGAVGSWQMLPGAQLGRMIASFGFDWILVDCEHGAIGDAEMHAIVPAIAAVGTSPIVRVPAPEQWLIKRALDCGAHGIMVPMVSSAKEAAYVVAAAKFPSTETHPNPFKGFRGAGSPFAPVVFGTDLVSYTEAANEKSSYIMVQIETLEGVKNVEEIAAVPGVDMLFIGPNDLSFSLGFSPSTPHQTNPIVQETIGKILAAAQKAGKSAGIFCVTPEEVSARFKQGFACCNMGTDTITLMQGMTAGLAKVHGA